jgi:hypothetical protein
LSSTYKSDYFRDEKILVFLTWSKPQGLKSRDKVHLNYGKSQTIRNINYATPWFYYKTLPAFKLKKYNRVRGTVAK